MRSPEFEPQLSLCPSLLLCSRMPNTERNSKYLSKRRWYLSTKERHESFVLNKYLTQLGSYRCLDSGLREELFCLWICSEAMTTVSPFSFSVHAKEAFYQVTYILFLFCCCCFGIFDRVSLGRPEWLQIHDLPQPPKCWHYRICHHALPSRFSRAFSSPCGHDLASKKLTRISRRSMVR